MVPQQMTDTSDIFAIQDAISQRKPNTDRSANLLLQGLQLSVFEKKLNRPSNRIANTVHTNPEKVDVASNLMAVVRRTDRPMTTRDATIDKRFSSSGKSSAAGHSIRLIFERAKNRTNDYRVKLQQNRSNAANIVPEPKMNTKRNVPTALISNRTLIEEKNLTKVAGFLNNKISVPPNKIVELSTETVDEDHLLNGSSSNNTKIPIYLTKLFKRVILSDNTKPRNKFATTIQPPTIAITTDAATTPATITDQMTTVKIKPIFHRMYTYNRIDLWTDNFR